MNVFQFKHVGKGLFYAGTISDDINFVYDCGTAENKMALNFEINALKFIFNKRKIDFVIISDLNSAYFNGLPLLCELFNVEKLYLPYFGENKEFIRFALIDTIFNSSQDSEYDEQLKLYCFMCKLYGIKSHLEDEYHFALPKKVIILGADDSDADKTCSETSSVIRRFREAEDNSLWKFFIINKCYKQDHFNNFAIKFTDTLDDFHIKLKKFNNDDIEKYLLASAKSREGVEKIHNNMMEIIGDAKNRNKLSSNILVHYPQSLLGNMYLCEYKNVNESYLQSMQLKIEGKITVLSGDAFIDKSLENQIFSCGNFAYNGGILQVPYNIASDNRPDLLSIARPFKTFVSTADAGNTDRINKRAVVKQITYPNKPIHIATQDTGILYFFG